jgi:hypothetical protein
MRFRTIVTAAALPLLTAGTLLSITDAANAATENNGQNSTTPNASVIAGLTKDKTYAWDVAKDGRAGESGHLEERCRQGLLHRQTSPNTTAS